MAIVYDHNVVGAYPHIKEDSPETLLCSRALVISKPEDVVVLDPALHQDLDEVLKYYHARNIPVSHRVTFDSYFSTQIRNVPDFEISRFLSYTRHDKKRPPGENTFEFFNNKSNFLTWMMQNGFNTPYSVRHLFGTAKVRIPKKLGVPFLLKKDLSCSGRDVYLCENALDVQFIAKKLKEEYGEARYHLQAYMQDAKFYNCMANLGEAADVPNLYVSRQILDGFVQIGSASSHTYLPANLKYGSNIQHTLTNFFILLQDIQCRGWIGIDFGIMPSGELFFLECNPRWNSALYAHKVAQMMSWEKWESRRIELEPQAFNAHDILQFLPSPDSVITNWGTIRHGWIDAVSPL